MLIWHASSGQARGVYSNDQLWDALDSSGQVWAWEYLSNSLVNGTKSKIQTTTPIQVSNLSNIVAISGRGATNDKSGYAHDSSGHVWAWRVGAFDELGKGTTMENQSPPVQVTNLSNIVEIAGEGSSGYALDSLGNVWAWGKNSYGQLGNGTITDSNVPVQVLGLPKQ